jgi:two-component sensor histidine kinase
MKRKGPKVINVGKKDKKDFDLLTKDKGSFFYGRDHKEVFIMAMVYGFLNNSSKTLGLKLVSTLAEQLQGSIVLDKSAGTSFKISFSKPQ